MKYCNKEDLFIRFGKSNVVQWSDAENSQDEDEINERIAWSILQATEEINERLRESPYIFPIENESVPLSIQKTCSEIAGIYLYDSRRINDNDDGLDEMQFIRTGIEEYFRQICGGKRILNLSRTNNVPFVVKNNNTDNKEHKWFCK